MTWQKYGCKQMWRKPATGNSWLMIVSQIGESRFGAMNRYWIDCNNSIVKKKNTPLANSLFDVRDQIHQDANKPIAAKTADISIEKHIVSSRKKDGVTIVRRERKGGVRSPREISDEWSFYFCRCSFELGWIFSLQQPTKLRETNQMRKKASYNSYELLLSSSSFDFDFVLKEHLLWRVRPSFFMAFTFATLNAWFTLLSSNSNSRGEWKSCAYVLVPVLCWYRDGCSRLKRLGERGRTEKELPLFN